MNTTYIHVERHVLLLVVKMKLMRTDNAFTVTNYDEQVGGSLINDKNGPFLPNQIRAIVSGSSNYGKTNLLTNFILSEKCLKFNNIILCSHTRDQDKYAFLRDVLLKTPEITFVECEDGGDFPAIVKRHSLIIFDDATDKSFLPHIRAAFTRSRHFNSDCFYLIQSYAASEKHLIRDNANLIILYPQDGRNLHLAWRDHMFADITYKQLIEMCQSAWSKDYNFLLVDKTRKLNLGRYRSGLDEFFTDI